VRKKAKARKVYSQQNPLVRAMTNVQFIPIDDLERLVSNERAALRNYSDGKQSEHDWVTINDALLLSSQFAIDGIGPEVIPLLKPAQDALIESRSEFRRSGSFGAISAGHLIGIYEIINIVDLQRRCVSIGQFRQIVMKLSNKIRSGHPDVIQLD
jgi:hypothetical protein